MQQNKKNSLIDKGFVRLYMAQATIKEQYEGCEVCHYGTFPHLPPCMPPPICGRSGMIFSRVRFIWVAVATHKDTPVIAFKQGVPYAVFPCVAYVDDISIGTPLKAEDVPNSAIAWLKENGYTINK